MNGPRLRAAAMLLGSALVMSCGERRVTAPGLGTAHLRVAFATTSDQTSGLASLRVRALWPKPGAGMVTLVEATAQASGTELSVPLEIDVATCLATAARPTGFSGCPLSIDIVLLDGQNRYLDSTRVGPLDGVAGATLTVPAIDVHATRPSTVAVGFRVGAGGFSPGATAIAIALTYPLAAGGAATLATTTVAPDTGQRSVSFPVDVTRCLYDSPPVAGAPPATCPLTVRFTVKDAQGIVYDSLAVPASVTPSGATTVTAGTVVAGRYASLGFPTGVDTIGGVSFGRSMRWTLTTPVFGTSLVDSLVFTRAIKASDTTGFNGYFGVGAGVTVELTRCVGLAGVGKTPCPVTAKAVLLTSGGTGLDSGAVKSTLTAVGGPALLAVDTMHLRTVRSSVLSISAPERLEGVGLAGDDWSRHGSPYVIGTDLWFSDQIFPNSLYRFDGTTLQTTTLKTAFSVAFNGFNQQSANVVWGASAGDVWVASNHRGIIDRVQNGVANIMTLPWALTPTSVWGSAANDVWVGTDSGVVLRYNGSAWTRTALPGQGTSNLAITQLRGTAVNNVYAFGPYNGSSFLWRFNGTSWSGVSSPNLQAQAPFTSMLVEASGVTVDAHAQSLVQRSDLYTLSAVTGQWTALPKLPDDMWVNQIGRDASGNLIVVGSRLQGTGITLFRRLPGVYRLVGNSWQTLNSGFPLYSRPVGVAVRNGVTTVLGDDGLLAEVSASGSVTVRNFQPYISSLAVTPNGVAWFGTTTGIFVKAPGQALTRVVQAGFEGLPIDGLAVTSDTSAYVMTEDPATGRVAVYYTNASGWKQIWASAASSNAPVGSLGAALVTNNAVFPTSDANGNRVLMLCNPLSCFGLPARALAENDGSFYSDKLLWVVDASGLFLYNGASWSAVPGAPANPRSVAGFPNVTIVADGTSIYRQSGGTWTTVTTVNGMQGLAGSQPDDLWSGDCAGHLLRFDGATVKQLASPYQGCLDQGSIGKRGGGIVSTGSSFMRGVGPLGTLGSAIGQPAGAVLARPSLRVQSASNSVQSAARRRAVRALQPAVVDGRPGFAQHPER